MMSIKRIIFLLGVSLVLASFLFFYSSVNAQMMQERLVLFYKDPTIIQKVHDTIVSNHNLTNPLITRLFINKFFYSLNNVFVSFCRVLDPVFLYSLAAKSSAYYYGGASETSLFSPLELPLALIAFITIIRKWDTLKKKYQFIFPVFIISIIFACLWLPYDYIPGKLIPLFLTLQGLTIFGLYEFIISLPWLKKFSLQG